MGEEREYLSGYKIMAGKKYKVNRIEHNGMVFYKIKVTQKDANGKQKYYDRIVNFRKNVNLPDKTMIIPIKFIENMRDNPKDKYNPIITLMIFEFEDLGTQEVVSNEAYSEFRANLADNEHPLKENFLEDDRFDKFLEETSLEDENLLD